jgi:hypothetical protein
MDQNKVTKLRDVEYKIRPQCGLCRHGEFKTIKDEFGSCLLHSYEHLKHTGAPRRLSVYRGGSCESYTPEAAKIAQLGAYLEFLADDR